MGKSLFVTHAMKSKLKAELVKLTEREMIAPVEESASWCSRIVVAEKKSGKLRICVDQRPQNKAHYPSTCHGRHAAQAVQRKSLLKTRSE